MRTIWKVTLMIDDEETITVPRGAVFRHVHMQHGQLCLWMEVDPSTEMEKRVVFIRGTGHPLPDAEKAYVGTAHDEDRGFVWHVFEKLRRGR